MASDEGDCACSDSERGYHLLDNYTKYILSQLSANHNILLVKVYYHTLCCFQLIGSTKLFFKPEGTKLLAIVLPNCFHKFKEESRPAIIKLV